MWLCYVLIFAIANPSVVCLLTVICLSSVTFLRLTQEVETFGNISSPFCSLTILWSPCKILRRSSQGNPSIRDVKHKRGSKIERWWSILQTTFWVSWKSCGIFSNQKSRNPEQLQHYIPTFRVCLSQYLRRTRSKRQAVVQLRTRDVGRW